MRNAALVTLIGLLVTSAVAIAAGPGAGGGVRVEGVITAINAEAQQLVVADTTIQVTPDTLIRMHGKVISFDDLAVGMTVAACGTLDDGVLTAKNVTVKYSGQ